MPRWNRPPSIANIFPRAASGSMIESSAPVAVPRRPRHRRPCSSSSSATARSPSASIVFRVVASLVFASACAVSLSAIASFTRSNVARAMSSQRGWFTTDVIGAFTGPSSSSSRPSSGVAVSSSSSSSSSSFPASSSFGSRVAAVIDRLVIVSIATAASSPSSLAIASAMASISAGATACWRMTRQCRARRCVRCASSARLSRVAALEPSRVGIASSSSRSLARAVFSSSGVSSSVVASSVASLVGPGTAAERSPAPTSSSSSRAPTTTASPTAPSSLAAAASVDGGDEDGDARGSRNGRSNRFATQQYRSHASDAIPAVAPPDLRPGPRRVQPPGNETPRRVQQTG
eukprot:31297-Pelagococcus_subviridis.AAC.3